MKKKVKCIRNLYLEIDKTSPGGTFLQICTDEVCDLFYEKGLEYIISESELTSDEIDRFIELGYFKSCEI